jgi:serine/threonine-protein kinase
MVIPDAAPARLGRYELLARLAAGGMGEIFLARLEGAAGFEKLFVIKRILPHLADDARFREMLIAEARIASVMNHANICQVYELGEGESDGQLFIAMEYLEGSTMLSLLHRLSRTTAPLALGCVAGVIQQAASGLHYAHELRDRAGGSLGIVHRDVTPSNIFVTDAGIVKILDFGIAKVKDASAHTQTGTVKGKYAYMSPEQLRGAAVDRRADVFALGIVLYETLALRRLFQRQTDYLTFRAVMEQPIPDVRHYRADCPVALAQVIARALERDPAHRFDSARQFGGAVLDAIGPAHRSWTQGEVGDFVAARFADDIARRRARVAGALHHAAEQRSAPVIVELDDTTEVELAAEFLPVDSALSDSPVAFPSSSTEPTVLAQPSSSRLAAVNGGSGQAPVQPPLAIAPVPGAAGPRTRRHLFWPIVTLAMVAVAGGALALVWRQMQNQQPTSVVIASSDGVVTSRGSDGIVVGPRRSAAPPAESAPVASPADDRSDPATAAAAPGATPGAGAGRSPASPSPLGPAQPAAPAPPRAVGEASRPAKHARIGLYRDVVFAHQAEVKRCTGSHGNPAQDARLVILLAADGRPKRIAIVPDSVDAAPIGACIKRVFQAVVFPPGEPDFQLEVNLRAR